MITVKLEGSLAKDLGKDWELDVESVFEIFQAFNANLDNFSKIFADWQKLFSHFIVYIDGKAMPAHLLKSKTLKNKKEVSIVPIVQGGAITGTTWMIIGITMMVLSIVLMFVLSPKAPKDIKTDSTIIGGVRNVLNRNIVIPIGYGRLRVGSAVVSNDLRVKQIMVNSNPTVNYYNGVAYSVDTSLVPYSL
jgi:predicted phage tail protein